MLGVMSTATLHRYRLTVVLPRRPGGGDDGGGGREDQDDAGDSKDKPKKRSGRCEAVECACRPTWPVSKPRPSSKKAAAD
jgi:hypothetical protein